MEGGIRWVSALASLANPARTGPTSGSHTPRRPQHLWFLRCLHVVSPLILTDALEDQLRHLCPIRG